VFARFERLPVQVFVLLHVRERDHEIKRFACEHRVNVRVVVRHLELLCPFARALGPNVTQAHHLGVRAFGEHRQIRTGNAPASDDSDSDAFGIFARKRPRRPEVTAAPASRVVLVKATTIQMRRGWLHSIGGSVL